MNIVSQGYFSVNQTNPILSFKSSVNFNELSKEKRQDRSPQKRDQSCLQNILWWKKNC